MAWIAPIAASIIGGIMSKQQSDKNRRQGQPLLDMQMQNAKELQPWAKQFLEQGAGAQGAVGNYYQKLLSGNRTDAMQAMAPEINSINSQNMGMVNASRELSPRGGMSSAQSSMIPWQNRGAVNNLLFSVRPMAAQGLGQLGGNMVSQGLGAMGLGSGMTNSMLNYGLQARQQNFDQGQQIGGALGGAYQNYLLYHMMNNGNTNPTAKLPSSGADPNAGNPYVGGTD